MTARVEYRVVVERGGQQWLMTPATFDEPITDLGAAWAYAEWLGTRYVPRRFDRVFIVHRVVVESDWCTDDGQPWDEQAASDRLLAVANERRHG